MEVLDASVVLLNSWVVDNVAHNGGGLNVYFGSHLVLSHVTMANNQPDGIFIHAEGIMGAAVNSILLDPVVNGRLAQSIQVMTTDPLFVDETNGDYHLQAGSPAIDAGYTFGAPLVDGDGEERPWGTAVDLGADEYHP